MFKALSILLAAVMLLPAPAVIGSGPQDVEVIAPYYIVVDADDPSVVFYERDPDTRCIPASTMKIMTCILTLEHVTDLDETVVVTRQAASMKETNSLMHVLAGETLSVRQLLYGMMLVSGNDAALLLAQHVAGSVEAFAELANAKAAEIGMTNSHFVNPSGAFNAKQYSTVRDMALLTSYALKNDMFRTLISTVSYTIEPNNVRKKPLVLINSDRLISDDPSSDCYSPLALGGKTGSTERGGDCLVAVGELDGARVIVVLVGADDLNSANANRRMPHVFQNAKYFIEYTLENDYALASPSAIGYSFSAPVTVPGLNAPVTLSAQFDEDDGVRMTKAQINQVTADLAGITALTEVSANLTTVKAGDVVGSISCSYGGRKLFSGELVADSDAVAQITASVVSPQGTPEPTAEPETVHPLAGVGAGFYIFCALGVLFLGTLGLLTFYFFKLELYKKLKSKKKNIGVSVEEPADQENELLSEATTVTETEETTEANSEAPSAEEVTIAPEETVATKAEETAEANAEKQITEESETSPSEKVEPETERTVEAHFEAPSAEEAEIEPEETAVEETVEEEPEEKNE